MRMFRNVIQDGDKSVAYVEYPHYDNDIPRQHDNDIHREHEYDHGEHESQYMPTRHANIFVPRLQD
ncbi:hypothetical protein NC651_003794 [Populus alba x Populus x berolinensis]|nr:hypothetical protein NC651_003794 [Populus alba x Populus x berolinensis]